jgi:transcription-repair coupling factor (superfamily II helicase)
MHQLRGRVGRSAVQAYAYFFHNPQRVLTEDSQNRLHAIYNYAYLGAGYEIAQSDLRIRGAGNLLGEAQSGLARAVGFEYYCELLARSIKDVRDLDYLGVEEWEDKPLIVVPLPAYIPHDYIPDPVLRLDVLRELSALADEAASADFAAGLADRFGEPPEEVLNLLTVVNLRNLATRIGCERLTYNRIKRVFTVQFFEDEGDWFKRASLLDSRFNQTGPQLLELALPFEGVETGSHLHEALSELARVKESS